MTAGIVARDLPLPTADHTDQEVVDVVRVCRGLRPRRGDASDLLRTHAQALVGDRPWGEGRWMPPQFVLVTVVCRSGRVVPGPEELFWLSAWRYSNHLANAFDGDVYLVTEHGWTGTIDQRAGFSPALGDGARHLTAIGPDLDPGRAHPTPT
ncbi:hypothetical protein GCM10023168_13760 [Fodinibacter luteus]|uniref:Nitroreductase n=1 Tax=Fodinibacter luteus TaxID=552064 RepID=A0ABP8KA89_9MICO